MKRTVFVVNHSGYSYKAAEDFGELVFLSRGYVNVKELDSIKESFINYFSTSSKEDYLVLSGNNLLCALAVILWKNLHGTCNVLHWNGSSHKYDLITL